VSAAEFSLAGLDEAIERARCGDRDLDVVDALARLGTVWSPDFPAFLEGKVDASAMRCALCEKSPCECPAFGTPEYFALLDRRHGRCA